MSDENLCMLRYYKRHIVKLKTLLNNLDPSSKELQPLAELQELLVDRIVATEGHIARQRASRRSLRAALRQRSNSRVRSRKLKELVSKCNSRITGYRFLLYIWRCFGDGIANKYVSKWNLKRLFYAHDSFEIKQGAGRLSGKEGIKLELLLMRSALSHGMPAVLSDLTNIIRHGDVCLLGTADPLVIEVKSSSNRNRRTGRQLQAIEAIHQYFENDGGPIAGLPNMKRTVIPVTERHYGASINQVADDATDGKWSRVSPEKGLYYVGLPTSGTNPGIEELFRGIEEPLPFMLNPEKTEMSWGNYYPFTLSLVAPRTLYAFLSGKIFLIVIVSQTSLRRRAADAGFDLSIVMADNVGFELVNLNSNFTEGVPFRVSAHFVGRLAFEFLSLDWFFESQRLMVDDLEREIGLESANAYHP